LQQFCEWVHEQKVKDGSKPCYNHADQAADYLSMLMTQKIQGKKISGRVNASISKRKQMCMDVDVHRRAQRAWWTCQYWKNALTPERVPDHLHHGWALSKGEHVYAEDVANSNVVSPSGKYTKIKYN